jgi:hypothetical protein
MDLDGALELVMDHLAALDVLGREPDRNPLSRILEWSRSAKS